jgi:hypothetical protein
MQETERATALASFLRLAQSLDAFSDAGNAFRDLVLDRGLPGKIGEYLTASFAELTPETTEPSSAPPSLPSTPYYAELSPEQAQPATQDATPSPGPWMGAGLVSPLPLEATSALVTPRGRPRTPLTQKGSRRWAAALAKPGVAVALQFLAVFVENHPVISLLFGNSAPAR